MSAGKDIKSVRKDIKHDIKIAKKVRLSWRGVLGVFILSLLVGGLFNYWGRFDLTLPVLGSVGAIGFVITVKQEMWAYRWFWTAMITLAALHVLLIVLIPWTTNRVPAMATAGAITIDF